MHRLKEKVALITGASQGIGEATARLFIAEGAKVILTDIQDQKGQDLCNELGPNAFYAHLDVQSQEEWLKIEAYIKEKYGKLDVIFNNAGITGFDQHSPMQDPEHTKLEDWQFIHRINLDGVFLGCQMAIRLMKQHGGSIINMGSRSGLVGIPGAAAYASSKAAILNHTRSVALYCAQHKYPIRCNALAPGAILTPLWNSMLGNTEEERQEHIKDLAQEIPLGHMGSARDVANAALFLAQDESSYMTGTYLVLDGGITAGSSAAPSKDKVLGVKAR
ncbi:MAG: short-chain dehydrogenase [Legionellales bacterium RIFCSPHIGHO2_12_FULL_37_14]|nr:MAG: short-chain dehydrogenase [Legionellales bacterium RIFCSPHIGHO2_12_FULL_37_14]